MARVSRVIFRRRSSYWPRRTPLAPAEVKKNAFFCRAMCATTSRLVIYNISAQVFSRIFCLGTFSPSASRSSIWASRHNTIRVAALVTHIADSRRPSEYCTISMHTRHITRMPIIFLFLSRKLQHRCSLPSALIGVNTRSVQFTSRRDYRLRFLYVAQPDAAECTA